MSRPPNPSLSPEITALVLVPLLLAGKVCFELHATLGAGQSLGLWAGTSWANAALAFVSRPLFWVQALLLLPVTYLPIQGLFSLVGVLGTPDHNLTGGSLAQSELD